jgi:aryl-alcohol dehydrogenase-like predicted oxidoreductase
MNAREIGKSGLYVAPLAFGGNVFGWTIDEPMSFRLLDAFVDAGFNLIDTADVYSRWVPGNAGGESETILGRWLKQPGKRDKVLIATKLGMEMGPGEAGLSRPYVFRAVEASLSRLQTDRIDLYQSHKDDPGTPQEETLGAFADLIRQGKVRAIGASNYSAGRLAEALALSKANGLPRYECLQPHYNVLERPIYEDALEPLCVREGLGVIPYFPLAAGFLSGKYRTEADLAKSKRGASVKKYLDERGLRVVDALADVAARIGATSPQVALAWLIARLSVTAPIVSATTEGQFAELAASATLKLDAAFVTRLNEASGASS